MSSRRFDDAARTIARLQRRIDGLERRASRIGHGHVLGYAEVTASQTGITTETDLTGLLVTVDVAASRRIRISAQAQVAAADTAAATTGTGLFKESTTTLGRWLRHTYNDVLSSPVVIGTGSVVITPSSGSHTYKLSLTGSGNGVEMQAASTIPAYILVEDLGAA